MLLTAGEADPIAKAYHAEKMAARLQAATSSSQPVLLRVEPGGHGPSSLDQRISELTGIYAFLFDALSIDYRPGEQPAGDGEQKVSGSGSSHAKPFGQSLAIGRREYERTLQTGPEVGIIGGPVASAPPARRKP